MPGAFYSHAGDGTHIEHVRAREGAAWFELAVVGRVGGHRDRPGEAAEKRERCCSEKSAAVRFVASTEHEGAAGLAEAVAHTRADHSSTRLKRGWHL